MQTQPNRNSGRKRKKKPEAKTGPAPAPVLIAARRPGSPRLEKPSRRMKAASARPKTTTLPPPAPSAEARSEDTFAETPRRPREARIVQRRETTIDETEQTRRRLLSQYMASEGRSAITRAADNYLRAGFEIPAEQEAQLQLLEHLDESLARQAIAVLKELIQVDPPRKLPLFRQRLRRLEDHAEDPATREAASELRRALPG
jgi:hypothetical protein